MPSQDCHVSVDQLSLKITYLSILCTINTETMYLKYLTFKCYFVKLEGLEKELTSYRVYK